MTTSSTGDLIAIEFEDDLRAREALLAFTRLGRRKSLRLDDAAIAFRRGDSRVRILQTRDVPTSRGALMGGWWGFLVGMTIGQPWLVAALGALAGGVWAWQRDIGINDSQMRRLADTMMPGAATAFFLINDAYPTHLITELRRFDGRLIHTTLSEPTSEEIELALSN